MIRVTCDICDSECGMLGTGDYFTLNVNHQGRTFHSVNLCPECWEKMHEWMARREEKCRIL